MAEEKKTEKKKTEKKSNTDRWLTISGVRKEAKRVRWPKWKSEGSTPGIAENSGEVLVFTGFFAAFFVLCDLFVAFFLRLLGIGA